MFKVGQKVVCIKVNPTRDLVEGEIYTVTDVRLETGGVKLKEVETSNKNCTGFFPSGDLDQLTILGLMNFYAN